VPADLCKLTAILISRGLLKLEDIWPHLSNFVETNDEIDEVESLIKKQTKLVEYQYKTLFESVMNKEAYEVQLKAKVAD